VDKRVTECDEGKPDLAGHTAGAEAKQNFAPARDDGLPTGWAQFHADVLSARRSVQPLAGWLLSGLLGLVVWLTVVYAPGAFERAKLAHGADPKGVITVEAGYITIVAVALIALAVAFEPFLSRLMEDGRKAWRSMLPRNTVLQLTLSGMGMLAAFVWHFPSGLLSFVDWLLARGFASAVGATLKGWKLRYGWGAVVIFAAIAAGLYAPPPWGLYAVIAGLAAILAIVRRWSWSEADRDTFLVERGIRKGAMRVGFEEDLRDEALVVISFLFVLIPIGLMQIQLATCADGPSACAFTLEGGTTLPPDALGQFVAWLGYFGAELAKSVPFVDWSEVFHVANDSPIKPQTPFGAQIVFAMRATLDLLLLAAVLQAVQIAGRLRAQKTAFEAGQLPILEPFAEARELRRVALGMEEALDIPPAGQHALASFKAYEDKRLQGIVRGEDRDGDPAVRRAAAALLARLHASETTDAFFTERAAAEPDPAMRSWIVTVASGLAPERDPVRREAGRARLEALLEDRFVAPPVRAAAARALGRIGRAQASTSRLLDALRERGEDVVSVRAAAAVALAKLEPAEASSAIEALAGEFKGPLAGDALVAAMATAHALARLAPAEPPEKVERLFDKPLREHALRASRIQVEPMTVEAARAREPGSLFDQLVLIAPGEPPFRREFTMGSSLDDKEAFVEEYSPQQMTMTRRARPVRRHAR
jgi:hypothetical protein